MKKSIPQEHDFNANDEIASPRSDLAFNDAQEVVLT
jgi:hypothetical protein